MRFSDITQRFQAVKNLLDPALGPDAKPLEIRAAVVDAIEDKVEPRGGGRRAFPYNRVIVRLLPRANADRSPLELAFADLDAKVRERFQEIRCDPPHALDCRVSFLKKAPPDWVNGQIFSVDCHSRAAVDTERSSSPVPSVRVIVLRGTATKKAYTFKDMTILMGRTPEVSEPMGRRRRNHVAFENTNASVSRAHARLKYDPARRHYHVLDDGSVHGTLVVRRGETIQVPKRDPRGVLLQSGDEIQLGDASVRVVFG